MGKQLSRVDISPGIAAAKRCVPYLQKAETAFLEACKKLGSEYSALPDEEKVLFRSELKIGRTTIQEYASIANKADHTIKVIESSARHAGHHQIPPSVSTWSELVRTDDSILKTAAKAGLFDDYEITRTNIRRFKTTGRLPAVKKSETIPKRTPVGKLRAEINSAERAINKAYGHISAARGLMMDHEISQLKGPELTALKYSLEMLCAELLATDPKMLDKALKILRGHV